MQAVNEIERTLSADGSIVALIVCLLDEKSQGRHFECWPNIKHCSSVHSLRGPSRPRPRGTLLRHSLEATSNVDLVSAVSLQGEGRECSAPQIWCFACSYKLSKIFTIFWSSKTAEIWQRNMNKVWASRTDRRGVNTHATASRGFAVLRPRLHAAQLWELSKGGMREK